MKTVTDPPLARDELIARGRQLDADARAKAARDVELRAALRWAARSWTTDAKENSR